MRRTLAIGAVFALVAVACSADLDVTDSGGDGSGDVTTDGGVTTSRPAASSTTSPPTTTTVAPTTTTLLETTTTLLETTTTLLETTTTLLETTTTAEQLPVAEAGTFTRQIDVNGVSRQYRLFIPAGLEPGRAVALVVDLHGFTSNPDNHDTVSQMRALAATEGFVVAQPSALGGIPVWDASADGALGSGEVDFVRAMVEDIGARAPIDRAQVFATGFSNGGGLVNRLACDASDVFAAVGTVSGAYVDWSECDPALPVAVISFHGSDDFVVPYLGLGAVFADVPAWAGEWAQRNGCGVGPVRQELFTDVYADAWSQCDDDADVVLFTIQDGLHSWPGSPDGGLFQSTGSISATETFWDFFQAHTR